MNLEEIKYCPGTLAEGNNTYSRACLRRVFHNKSVSHILPYNSPQSDEDDDSKFVDNRKRISISGVQEKMSLILDKNKLRLTDEGEQGNYILKPIPRDLKKVGQVPANEHLTMQIAQQVFGIYTAENALIFFKDGKPAYITKRFDIKDDGTKLGKEDFASLAGKTEENAGANFKYDSSYEEMAELLKKFVPAYKIEVERLYRLIVFNYLFSNGDAHLKNFSLLESPNGDYLLSPAYDLVTSRIHTNDPTFGVDRGLFKDDFKSAAYKRNGYPGIKDFIELAKRMEIMDTRINKILGPFLQRQDFVQELVNRSFLNDQTKKAYLLSYNERRNYLNN